MPSEPVVDLADDPPISIRRKRRGRSNSTSQPEPISNDESTSTHLDGLATPPETPHRSGKRVRFSNSGPSSSTGLTPSFSQNSLTSPAPSKLRRQFVKCTSQWNMLLGDSPVIVGTMQLAPFSLSLDGRVERSLVRNELSAEENLILFEERLGNKSWRVKFERLQDEIRQKDEEIAHWKNIANQGDVEIDIPAIDSSRARANSEDLDDPFGEEFPCMPGANHEFNMEIPDVFHSTLHQPSFPSLIESMSKTPSNSTEKSSAEPTDDILDGEVDIEDISSQRGKLLDAAMLGQEERVRRLLDWEVIDVNQKDNLGRTALWYEARNGHCQNVMLLLERKNIDPNVIENCPNGHTPLMIAALKGHENVVRLLSGKENVNINAQNGCGDTALWCAAESGHTAVVKLLLERLDVDVKRKNAEGETMLWLLASSGLAAAVELFLTRKDVDPNEKCNRNQTPLMAAARNGHKAVVQQLLHRSDVKPDILDGNGWNALAFAADGGYEEVVGVLLKGDDDNTGRALGLAALGGHETVVRLLLGHGVNVESREIALGMASGNETVARLLRESVELSSK